MEKQLEGPLKIAIEVLEKNGYRYAVIGGLALAQWGIVRLTKDIDLKVLVPDLDYKKARSIIKSAFPKAARQTAPENHLIVATTINNVIVDFLLAIPGYEELIIERAVSLDLDGWKVWICSAEDLIIQKMVAGREKDFQDIHSILVVQKGKLDHLYIENWLAQFAEVLEQPELLSHYHSLIDKASRINKTQV